MLSLTEELGWVFELTFVFVCSFDVIECETVIDDESEELDGECEGIFPGDFGVCVVGVLGVRGVFGVCGELCKIGL